MTNIDSFVATNIPALPLKADIKPESNGNMDLFKALNLQDGSLYQQSSMPDMTKLLTTYLQSLSSTNNLTLEFKAALSKFPALEALLRKDTALGTENDHVNTTTTTEHVVHTTTPTNPSMYITVVDNIAVCVAVLAPTETVPECRIMRRLDTNYINGTTLLTAGGIETESERSMILSFEMDRRRVPKQKSGLYGTWIPLRRAQELAVTHSIQHRLGVFLSENIEKYFPSPLPITISRRSPSNTSNTKTDNHSLALQALRNPNKHHPTTPSSSSPLTTSATQIHQLLLSHNSRQLAEYAQKAPLLGTFDDYNDKRQISVIDSASVATRMALATKRKKKQQQRTRNKRHEEDGSDVDIVNSGSEADDDDDDDGGDTDTDHDVEEVRRRKKRMRDAAIEAMESGSSMDLEELLRRASSPIMGGNQRNNSNNMAWMSHDKMRSKVTSPRRRPQMQSGGGGKIAPSKMKRSATWSGSMSSPLRVVVPNKKLPSQHAKKQNGVTRPSKLRNSSISSDDDNCVVEHAPTPTSTAVGNNNKNNTMTSSTLSSTTTTTSNESTLTTIKEDDEDEEIDIGGSDRDDDLR